MKKMFYDVEQAARTLGVPVREIEKLIAQGTLESTHLGNRVVIPATAVLRLVGTIKPQHETPTIESRRIDSEPLDLNTLSEQVKGKLKEVIGSTRSETTHGSTVSHEPDEGMPQRYPRVRQSSGLSNDYLYLQNNSHLSLRTKNCLRKAGIRTFASLSKHSPEELIALPGFGTKCLREVESLLAFSQRELDAETSDHARSVISAYENLRSLARAAPGPEHFSFDTLLVDSPAYTVLSSRARTCLARAGVKSVNDLRVRSAEELLSIRGFGIGCLGQVNSFFEKHRVNSGEIVDDLEELLRSPRPESLEDFLSLLTKFASARQRLEKWSAPNIDSALDVVTQCQDKVEQQVAQGMLDDHTVMEWPILLNLSAKMRPPALSASGLLSGLQYFLSAGDVSGLGALNHLDKALEVRTVDEELKQLLERLGGRSRYVFEERFHSKPKTLAELGEELEVSRERVRQLESEAKLKLQQGYVELPLLRTRTAMMQVRSCEVFSREEIYSKLYECGLISHSSTVEDLFSTVEDLLAVWKAIQPRFHPFPEEIRAFTKTGLTPLQQQLSNEILAASLHQLRVVGAISLEEVVAGLKHPRCSVQDVIAVLSSAGLRKLVPGCWGTTDKRYALHRVAEKMIKVCGPLHIGYLHVGLLRHQQRLGRSAPPTDIMHAALDVHEAFLVDPEDVVYLHDLSAGALPNDAEYAWLQAVNSFGPVIHVSTMYRTLKDRGLNSGLANYLTKLSELVQPIGDSLYCLPGAQPTEVEIEAGRAQASEQWTRRYLGEGYPSAEDRTSS